MKPAVFLDRDGVINIDKGYVNKISEFEWIEGSKNAIKYIKDQGYYIFVVTNQSGIARGYYTDEDVVNLHKYINNELGKINTLIDEFFYSPYHPDYPNKFQDLAHLRKPNTGMLKIAENKWHFDKSKSFLIGDKVTDIECARNFGIKSYMFKSNNLFEFIKKINF